ncbi:hypothetical protein [Burkholderia plantarii]|uniref:hypothetical protein n=1 Tax=Burkholderia plantarii TaxID=41899 RepID=UPI00087076C9|nr:hypothetical protein [Burkholderia plantarii]
MTSEIMLTRAAAKAAKKRADSAFYGSQLTHQRERFAKACSASTDDGRRQAANQIVEAAKVFEQDARRMPSRAKRAIELLKQAVFMLDPRAPA